MNAAVVRGAFWANDLRRLERAELRHGDYLLTDAAGRVAELAAAAEVGVEVVQQRLERGCQAFVAWSPDDAVVSWLWVSFDQEWAEPIRQDLHFGPDECYGWGARTLPPHRGRGLFTALLRHAGWRMAREGRRWIWGGIEDRNVGSLHANAGAGYRPVVRLTAVHEPPPTRLRVRPADYADPDLVRRAWQMLGMSSRLVDEARAR